MIDPRCLTCCEHMTVLGNCGGHVVGTSPEPSRLACFVPAPTGRSNVDELSGDLPNETGYRLPATDYQTKTGTGFPALVGLLSPVPACSTSAAEGSPSLNAACEVEPGADAVSPRRAALAGRFRNPLFAAPSEPRSASCSHAMPGDVIRSCDGWRTGDGQTARMARSAHVPVAARSFTHSAKAAVILFAMCFVSGVGQLDAAMSTVPYPLSTVYIVTAYCPCKKCCGPKARGITASGKRVSANGGRFVAADPSLKFGTMVKVPGYAAGAVPVLDRGGAIKGNRIDVFFPTHAAAKAWGRRTLMVEVVGSREPVAGKAGRAAA